MKLVIASRNVHKIRELRSILKGGPWDLFSLIDFPQYHPPEENGATFEENASLKAIDAAKALEAFTIADDSGLVVPALDGAPGIHSARFAGNGASDKENRRKLLQAMSSLKGEERFAYYICCVAIGSPKGIEKIVSARTEGIIIEEERGGQGFGYDSIFQKFEYHKTFAELEEEVKNRISHRRKAVDKILPTLDALFALPS